MQRHEEIVAGREEILVQRSKAGAHVHQNEIGVVLCSSHIQEKADRSGEIAESQQRAAKLLGDA